MPKSDVQRRDTGLTRSEPGSMKEVSSQRQYLLNEIFGLAVACPFDQGNPCNCPLHELRKKTLRERHEWLQALSEEDISNILTFHKKCLGEKENSN
jgi:hypothetical protein